MNADHKRNEVGTDEAGSTAAGMALTSGSGQPAVMTPLADDRKRPLPADSPPELDMEVNDIAYIYDGQAFPDAPPEGVHRNLWGMLKMIHQHVTKINGLENRVAIMEDQIDNDGSDIAQLKATVGQLVSANKTLSGRLLRAESVIQRQQDQIIDLKTRSMRDNVIIKTRGSKYKEHIEENTDSTIRKFFTEEMRIPNSENLCINSSHRMGQANAGYNRMLIARLPRRRDHTAIFDNASALKGTEFSISKQVPPETEERRQFAWADFKKAKSEKKPVRFDGGTLVIAGTPVSKYQPHPLPANSNVLQGLPCRPPVVGVSDVSVEAGHMFRAWAFQVSNAHEVREGYDHLLQTPELAEATFVPYEYRYNGPDGKHENFQSDGDISSGLSMIKVLRELSADNVAVFVAHFHSSGNPLSKRKKMDCLSNVIGGAVMALSAAIPAY